jgi:hypothetical protein
MLGPGVWPIGARYFGRKRINFRVLSDRPISACRVRMPGPRIDLAGTDSKQ